MDSNAEKDTLESLKRTLQEDANIKIVKNYGQIPLGSAYQADAYFLGRFGKKEIPICVEVKGHITNLHQIKKFTDFSKSFDGLAILVAEFISESSRIFLRECGIGYLERLSGELFLPLKIQINSSQSKGQNSKTKESGFRAVNRLKLLFYFLTEPKSLKLPQRSLSKDLEISLGGVNKAIQELKSSHIIQSWENSNLELLDKKKAVEKWATEFSNFDKNKLLIGRFSPVDSDFFNNWQPKNLGETSSYWGGEPAASLLTGYLQPEVFKIYSYESQILNFLKSLRLKKDEKGKVFIYRAFWPEKLNNTSSRTCPWILAYADLINSGIDRNIETAEEMLNKYLRIAEAKDVAK